MAERGEPPARRSRADDGGPGPRRARLSAVMRAGERVKPLELFFDLVFVLALTQCTALMVERPSFEGIAQGLVVLALLLGGVAVYLLGHAAIRCRHVRTLNRRRTALAVALPAAVPLTPEVPSLVPLAATVALLAAVIVYETHRYGEGRARVRHSFETARH